MKKNNFVEGIKFALGILFVFTILGVIYAVGFHTPNEILSGIFQGNYSFNGSVNFTNSNVSGLAINPTNINSGTFSENYIYDGNVTIRSKRDSNPASYLIIPYTFPGTHTGTLDFVVNSGGWGSYTYDIKMNSLTENSHYAGQFYNSNGIYAHTQSITSGDVLTVTNVGCCNIKFSINLGNAASIQSGVFTLSQVGGGPISTEDITISVS